MIDAVNSLHALYAKIYANHLPAVASFYWFNSSVKGESHRFYTTMSASMCKCEKSLCEKKHRLNTASLKVKDKKVNQVIFDVKRC